MMIRIVLAVAVAALGVTAVVAQGDPIAARKAMMKANGDAGRIARRDDRRASSRSTSPRPRRCSRPSEDPADNGQACSPTTPRPAATPRRCPRSGRTRPTSTPSSPSSAPMPRPPSAKVTDLDSFKAADRRGAARTAAAATRPIASGSPDRLRGARRASAGIRNARAACPVGHAALALFVARTALAIGSSVGGELRCCASLLFCAVIAAVIGLGVFWVRDHSGDGAGERARRRARPISTTARPCSSPAAAPRATPRRTRTTRRGSAAASR